MTVMSLDVVRCTYRFNDHRDGLITCGKKLECAHCRQCHTHCPDHAGLKSLPPRKDVEKLVRAAAEDLERRKAH